MTNCERAYCTISGHDSILHGHFSIIIFDPFFVKQTLALILVHFLPNFIDSIWSSNQRISHFSASLLFKCFYSICKCHGDRGTPGGFAGTWNSNLKRIFNIGTLFFFTATTLFHCYRNASNIAKIYIYTYYILYIFTYFFLLICYYGIILILCTLFWYRSMYINGIIFHY